MQKITVPSLEFSTQNSSSDTIFYNIVGNFVPPEWRGLTSHTGKALSKTSIQILSLLVSRTPSETEKAASLERNSISTPNELQETYYYFEQLLGLCQRRIRQCLVELEKSGYIKLTLINMTKQYIKYHNIICISFTKNFAPYPQKFSAESEKVFRCTRNNFHPHYIIDNNISINKSRYKESNFEKTFFKDNFSEKVANEELEENSNTAFNDNNTTKDDDDHPPSSSDIPKKLGENGWLSKAKRWCKGKTLAEFHPLTEEDARTLRLKSNRDFNLNFINKLLLRLAEKNTNNRFYSKNAMLNYMTKALIFEMREASLVNNEGFNFAMAHDIKQREEFLSKIENSADTSLQVRLEKKIAGVFRPDIAYSLLKSCRPANYVSEVYKLKLTREIELSKNMQEALLNQIRAVYGSVSEFV
ncbi:MAG: hypothetical protein ACIPMY_04260 [Rickettsia endosymbiont of Pentastiridius leporinus]